MSNYIILNKKNNIKKVNYLFNHLGLQKKLKNARTEIWENEDIQVSVDRSIIRILVYSKEDIQHYTKMFTKG